VSNCVFGFPVYSDVGVLQSPALSGGSWESLLPLSNAQLQELALVARSTNALETSTLFDLDCGTVRSIRVHALWKHNLTSAGVARVRAFTTLPIADFRAVGDASWTAIVTPTRTAGAATVDGIPLDLIGDDNNAATEGYQRQVTLTGDGTKVFDFLMKRNSAYAGQFIYIRDDTAATTRGGASVDFSSATPVVTGLSGATILSTVLSADGTGYRVTVQVGGVVAANNNQVYVVPAGTAGADTASFYVGDIRVWNASTAQMVYDSGFTAAYPAGQTAEDVVGMNLGWRHISSAAQSARYWRYNILDTANPAGYVQFARLYTCGGWQPTIGVVYGESLGVETDTRKEVGWGGNRMYDVRPRYRVQRFAFEGLPDAESLENAFRRQFINGIHGDFFFVMDPSDTYLHERSFPCTIRQLSAFEMREFARYNHAWEVEEWL
jgi:hypothetical protein